MKAELLSGLTAAGALGLLLAVNAAPAAAQRFPNFGGVEARVGVVLPDGASTGLSTAVDADLGYVVIPLVRPVIGFHHLQADVRDGPLGASGSFAGMGGRVGARVDFIGVAGARPYALAAVTVHNVTVDADNSIDQNRLDAVYGGFLVGGSLGGGVAYAIDGAQQFLGTAEVRRVWNANVPHWGAEVGVRIVPRGRAAYDRVPRYRDPWEAETARLRAEQERLLAREAERRFEQERLDRLTAEERQRLQPEPPLEARPLTPREAELEAELARARQEAELARAEAERARREAERPEAVPAPAVPAEAEVEARLYRELLELERLVPNVTAVRQTERGTTLVLGQDVFAPGQASLTARARDEVQLIAGVLLQYPEFRVAVEGHTDATGSMELNQRLSEQRAMAVRAVLVQYGLAPGRVDMVGHGPTLPIADNATAAGRAQNRRVEIVVLGAQRPLPGRR